MFPDFRKIVWCPQNCSPALPFGILLGALPLLAEHVALVLGLAFVVLTLDRIVRGGEESLCPADLGGWLAAGALSLALAILCGGVLTAWVFRLPGAEEWAVTWPGSAWPSLWDIGNRQHPEPGSADYLRLWLRDLGLAPLLAPVLFWWVFRPGAHAPRGLSRLLAAALPAAAFGWYLSPVRYAGDLFRFSQLFTGMVYLVAGLWLARIWDARPGWAGKIAAGVGLLLLCLQGARTSMMNATVFGPGIPFRYDAGMEEALRTVEARGQSGEGILAQVALSPDVALPAAPGLLGRPVPCTDPHTPAFLLRSRAWREATDTPSPANLRAARVRWVCFGGEDLSRAVPILEGLPQFEPHGIFGADPPYRLYRYAGPWELPEDGLWRAKRLVRHPLFGASCGGQRLTTDALAGLSDGDPASCISLPATEMASEGLVLVPQPETAERARAVSFVWVLGRAGTDLSAGLSVELLVDEPGEFGDRPDVRSVPEFPRREWRPVNLTAQQVLRDPKAARAWGVSFAPARAAAVRLRFAEQAPASVEWAEVYVGRAEGLAGGGGEFGPHGKRQRHSP